MQISKILREEARDYPKREKVYQVDNYTPAVIPVGFKVTIQVVQEPLPATSDSYPIASHRH